MPVRVVRPMNLLVAVHAGLAVDLVGVLRVVQDEALVDGRRVPRGHVAALAEERLLGDEHAVVVADPCGSWQVVQLSTTGACSHRNGPRFSAWQLVQLWSMVVPTLQQLDVDRAVHVVARRAGHLALAHRHVVEAQLLVDDGLMAAGAGDLLGLRLAAAGRPSASARCGSRGSSTLRFSCWLPSQSACSPRLWQVCTGRWPRWRPPRRTGAASRSPGRSRAPRPGRGTTRSPARGRRPRVLRLKPCLVSLMVRS